MISKLPSTNQMCFIFLQKVILILFQRVKPFYIKSKTLWISVTFDSKSGLSCYREIVPRLTSRRSQICQDEGSRLVISIKLHHSRFLGWISHWLQPGWRLLQTQLKVKVKLTKIKVVAEYWNKDITYFCSLIKKKVHKGTFIEIYWTIGIKCLQSRTS